MTLKSYKKVRLTRSSLLSIDLYLNRPKSLVTSYHVGLISVRIGWVQFSTFTFLMNSESETPKQEDLRWLPERHSSFRLQHQALSCQMVRVSIIVTVCVVGTRTLSTLQLSMGSRTHVTDLRIIRSMVYRPYRDRVLPYLPRNKYDEGPFAPTLNDWTDWKSSVLDPIILRTDSNGLF